MFPLLSTLYLLNSKNFKLNFLNCLEVYHCTRFKSLSFTFESFIKIGQVVDFENNFLIISSGLFDGDAMLNPH